MGAEEYIAIAIGVSTIISVINAATNHYSTIDGPWYLRVVRLFLWTTEKLSVLGSKDGARVVKLPLQDSYDMPKKPKDTGSYVLEVCLFTAMAISVWIGFTGCAAFSSASKGIETTQRIANGASVFVDGMCGPVDAACENPAECDALRQCINAQIAAAKSLRSAQSALLIASLAAEAGQDAKFDEWVSVAVKAITEVTKIIEEWRGYSWEQQN